MEEVSDLTSVVMWFGLVAGTLCLLVGGFVAIVMALKQSELVKSAEGAVAKASAASSSTQEGVAAQSEAAAVIDAVGSLATAMKDLDVGTRIMLLSVVFYGIASIAAGLDAIGTGIAT